jgi:phosphoenolpyruvate carboxykinase (ATP)
LLHAALNGELDSAKFVKDPIFNLEVPTKVADIPDQILRPKDTWADAAAYDKQAHLLAKLFEENFQRYSGLLSEEIRRAGPILLEAV